MTNEEKAKQIATGNRGYYPDANDFEDYKARYSAALEMAEYKDNQFKEFLQKIGRGEKWAAFERFRED